MVLLLRGEAVCSTQIGRPMSPSAYLSLAPAIWFLLDSQALGCAGQQQGLLHAVIDHSLKAPSKSATKGPSIDFIARLVLVRNPQEVQVNHFTKVSIARYRAPVPRKLQHRP